MPSSEPGRPIDDGDGRAVALDQLGDVGLDPMAARLAPHDEPHLGGERLAEHQAGVATWLSRHHIGALMDDAFVFLLMLLAGSIAAFVAIVSLIWLIVNYRRQ